MALPFQNVYHLRTVADASAKPCFVCMKTSNRVLITTDNKDFFYTCIGHLKDRGFAIPVTDQEAEDAKEEGRRSQERDREGKGRVSREA